MNQRNNKYSGYVGTNETLEELKASAFEVPLLHPSSKQDE